MARMRYVVTGGTGFIGRRVVSRSWPAPRRPAEVWVLVRRESLARFERLAAEWGDRAKPLVGDLTAADLGLTDETLADLGAVDHVVHCARDLRHHRRRRRAARRQRRRHPRGDRRSPAGSTRRCTTCRRSRSRATSPASTPRTTSTSRRTCRRRITRPSSRPSCWCARRPGCAIRIYRPAVVVGDSRTGEMDKVDGPVLLLRHAGEAGAAAQVHADRAAGHRTHQHRPGRLRGRRARRDLMHVDGRDGQTFHLTAPKTIGLRGIYRGVAEEAGLPPLRGIAARCGRDAVPQGHRARQGPAQHGGHPARHPRRDPRRRRPRPDVHRPTTPQKRCGARESACPSSRRTRRSCGGTGPSTSTPTGPDATIPAGPLVGRHVIITGASSGIGRASAIAVAERGATVFALARNAEALDDLIAEIRESGGDALRIHV